MSNNEVCPIDHTWDFDPITGEVRERVVLGSRYIQPLVLDEITSKATYDKAVKEVLAGRKYRLWVSPFLLDIIIDKELEPREIGLFCFLGQNIAYNNLVYISTKEIISEMGYKRETVSRGLSVLESKFLIRKLDKKLEGKDDRMYQINPLYFFLGYYPNRDKVIGEWMMGK